MTADPVQSQIQEKISKEPIVCFVKGNREFPMCGFSKGVMELLDKAGAEYVTVDVLSDPAVREGVKQLTQWPTIPQVFFGGEFVGGYDIIRDLHTRGELKSMVDRALAKNQ